MNLAEFNLLRGKRLKDFAPMIADRLDIAPMDLLKELRIKKPVMSMFVTFAER